MELGPAGALVGAIAESANENTVTTPALRDHHSEVRTLLTAIAHLFVHGAHTDWTTVLPEGTTQTHIDLPTYAFEHQRYWLPTTPALDAVALGQSPVDHPLLDAMAPLPHSDGLVLTSRLSLSTHPWLADHAIGDVILMPGTGLVEMAVAAGNEADCGTLDELVIETPLTIPEHDTIRIQVTIGRPDRTGTRSVSIHSAHKDTWTRHATGTLSTTPSHTHTPSLTTWPPPDAQRTEVSYEQLTHAGYTYGPAFQGVRKVWQHSDEIFAEVTLPDGQRQEAARYGIHPALLDAALHASGFAASTHGSRTELPFAWNGLALHAPGAASLRVRLLRTGPDTLSLEAADETGAPVLTIDSLAVREVSTEQWGATEPLFRVEWVRVPGSSDAPAPTWVSAVTAADLAGPAAGDTVPQVLAVPADGQDDALDRTSRVLDVLQAWLADEAVGGHPAGDRHPGCDARRRRGHADRTRRRGRLGAGACRAGGEPRPDRPPRHRHRPPDTDGIPDLGTVLATGEPQLALRGTTLYVPRLTRAAPGTSVGPGPDPDGTVLITGGTGSLGGLLARHLVQQHGIRSLVLASRRGPEADGAQDLVTELKALGADSVAVTACDVTQRDAVAALLAAIPGTHPLTAVIHTAGVLDDGVIDALDHERLARVFGPKVTAVHHLDQLTREHTPDLSLFTVFSSAAGLLGSAGQGNYAAANACMDGLMAARRAAGFPAQSLAWGLWEQTTGMGTGATAAAARGDRRGGVLPLGPEEGLDLFDAALGSDDTLLVPVKLDLRSLSTDATAGVSPLLRRLVRAERPSARAAVGDGGDGLLRRLAGLGRDRQEALLLDVVRGHAARVLGHATADGVGTGTAFVEAGFDSLTSVELRNQLRATTGIGLSATAVFDHPTPLALARHLHSELVPDDSGRGPAREADEERLRHTLLTVPLERFRAAGLLDALVGLADLEPGEPDTTRGALADLDVDELVRLALGDG